MDNSYSKINSINDYYNIINSQKIERNENDTLKILSIFIDVETNLVNKLNELVRAHNNSLTTIERLERKINNLEQKVDSQQLIINQLKSPFKPITFL